MIQGAVISILGFFALWGLAFFVNLVLVPGKIDADQQRLLRDSQAMISQLRERLAAPKIPAWELERRNLISEKLAGFTDQERAVLRHILQHGEANPDTLVSLFGDKAVDRAIREGVILGLVLRVNATSYGVNPDFKDALRFYFHGE